MSLADIGKLVVCVVVCEAAGVIGALTTDTGRSAWYQGLIKPSFNPPGWVFGPVWTTLYLLMGIAAFLVWREGASRAGVGWALVLFAGQLALNAVWTPVFFGLHSMGGALAIILLMWGAIVATIVAFWPISHAAAMLLIPYLLWVSFATVLNASFWMLNRGAG